MFLSLHDAMLISIILTAVSAACFLGLSFQRKTLSFDLFWEVLCSHVMLLCLLGFFLHMPPLLAAMLALSAYAAVGVGCVLAIVVGIIRSGSYIAGRFKAA